MPRYAISDIHGCAKTFRAALQSINFNKEDELFLLGDYIDRGPDSMGVLEHIWQLQASGHELTCLRGNHEQMLIDYVDGKNRRYEWAPPRKHHKRTMSWMNSLKYYQETPGYLLVHAGLNFLSSDPLMDEESMLWIRNWYGDLDRQWLGDRILVHGHTPAPYREIEQGIQYMAETRRGCIDSGCPWQRPGMSYLTVLNLDAQETSFIERVDFIR